MNCCPHQREDAMCRWLAYSGSPVRLEELLYKPTNSLVMQSKHARMGVETTNGDGFGVGWYGSAPYPGLFHSTGPAGSSRIFGPRPARLSNRPTAIPSATAAGCGCTTDLSGSSRP